MDYSFLTTRKNIYNFNTWGNLEIEKIMTLSFVLGTFNLGAYFPNDDEYIDEEIKNEVGYFAVVQGMHHSIEQCKANGVVPNYFEIVHFEHVFWFGFFTVTQNTYYDEEIRDLGKNVEFIYENKFVDSFSDTETNQFICDYLEIEEGELDIMFSGCIRLVESELEFDGFTIRVEDGYYILNEDDAPIFILPKGNSEDEKRHSLYNIFKVLVERIGNEK